MTTPAQRPAMIRFRTGKMDRPRLRPGRIFGEEKVAAFPQRVLQAGVFARVVDVQTASEHRDGPSRTLEGSLMSGGVHAAGKSGRNAHARPRKVARQPRCDLAPVTRSAPGSHDADGRQLQPFEASPGEKNEGRVGDLQERLRIGLVEGGEHRDPGALETRGPSLGVSIVGRSEDRPGPLRANAGPGRDSPRRLPAEPRPPRAAGGRATPVGVGAPTSAPRRARRGEKSEIHAFGSWFRFSGFSETFFICR